MIARLENKHTECISMPARNTEDFSSVTAMIISNEEKILRTYFYEGLREIDYAMSYYVGRSSEESLCPMLVKYRSL